MMNRFVACLLVGMCGLGMLGAGAHAGLVAHWTFDDTFADSSPSGYNGTPSGGLTFSTDVPPIVGSGKSVLFNASPQSIAINTLGNSLAGSYSVATWAKLADTGNQREVISSRSPSDRGFDFKFQNGNQIHGDIGSGSAWMTTGADLNTGYAADTWYHVTYSVRATSYDIYLHDAAGNLAATRLNGTYGTPGTPLLFDPTHHITIGRYGSEQFLGRLDEMTIWDVSLNVAQVHALANGAPPAHLLTALKPIPGLFNTGVDDNGVPLPNGPATLDPHYTIIAGPAGLGPAHLEDETAFPIVSGPWLANSPTSKWIAPQFNTSGAPGGVYDYELLFDLTGFDPATAYVTGSWATDNPGLDILLNGASTGQTSGGFGALTPFTLASGFVDGVNSLVFRVRNNGTGYTGLRVEGIQGFAYSPEPATCLVLAAGLLALVRRRRKA